MKIPPFGGTHISQSSVNSALHYQKPQEQAFLDVAKLDSNIVIDLPYASANNFTGNQVYPSDCKALLRAPVAEAISRVNKELISMGLRLKIWDAYRPFSIQERFWQIMPDARYVAEPVRIGGQLIKGSVHSRGGAVDCTIVDSNGKELEMPTEFDDFSVKAHRDYQGASPVAKSNRALLQSIMEKHGFVGLPTEWWHFDWKDSSVFELCDQGFDIVQGVKH